MRVAFITHFTKLYGANRSLLNLLDGLKSYEVSVCVVSPQKGELNEALQNRGIPTAIIPIQRWVSCRPLFSNRFLNRIRKYIGWRYNAAKRLCRNLCILPALIQQLLEWKIDVIYTNASDISIGVLAAMRLRKPHVWHLREFGDLDYGLQPDWGRGFFRYVINTADALITNSEAVRTYLLRDITNKCVQVIYNGVAWETDFERLYDLVQTQPCRRQPYTFALVGLIHPCKQHDTAIRALAIVADRYPNVRLLIVGGGDTNHLRQLANKLGVADKIEFWGYVCDPYTVYIMTDTLLMCSKYEAMGRVTAEAMAACRPVIGYDNAGTSEIIEHEHTGLLYRGGSEALAMCMMRFIENPEWGRELGKNGWHIARQKYSIEIYSKSIYRVLQLIWSRK